MTVQELMVLAAAGGSSLVFGAAAIHASRRWKLFSGVRRVPALGGLAVILGFGISVFLSHALEGRVLLSLVIATLLLIVIGMWDTRRPLNPWIQLCAQGMIAALIVIGGNIVLRYITHPFGTGLLRFDQWTLGSIVLPGALLAMIWIMALMNAMNFLDGVDGLAAGVGIVAFVVIGVVSVLPEVNDPATAFLAFSASMALGGFLFWNLPPAALYLGTTGSWFMGFLLAILSLQGSTKIATVAVVGAIPILDAGAVILGRLQSGRSPLGGDYTHLHHRLLAYGFSERSILLFYLIVSSLLGIGAVTLQTRFKVLVFALMAVVFLCLLLLGPQRRYRVQGGEPPAH